MPESTYFEIVFKYLNYLRSFTVMFYNAYDIQNEKKQESWSHRM